MQVYSVALNFFFFIKITIHTVCEHTYLTFNWNNIQACDADLKRKISLT